MHYIIALRRALSSIYRSGLIFCVVLSIGGGCKKCSDNQNKTPPPSGQQTLLDGQAVLENANVPQQGNKQKEIHNQNPDELGNIEPPVKKLKKLKRVAKVPEDKQVVLCLHGLHRLSCDFAKMIAVLQPAFPYATIQALQCVDKDPNKKGTLYISPTMRLGIQKQASLVYEEIKTKVAPGSHVVLVGHSQGGLRAFTLIKAYRSRLKSECGITIDRLITIGTPWQGAPMLGRITEDPKCVIDTIRNKKINNTLDAIKKDYADAILKYFFKFLPAFAERHPKWYKKMLNLSFTKQKLPGCEDLKPQSDFIRKYVPSGLKDIDVPITAIAGVCTDFAQLFEPFPSSISPQELAQLNATYAELIGGDPKCAHDMLLTVATQHAEGLVKKNFKCITVEGACHGNKVGVSIKRGLSELNNEKVIEQVVKSIEGTFYKEIEEIEKEEMLPAA